MKRAVSLILAGSLAQNADGCTYLDMLKTLYDRIQNGQYEQAV